MDHQAVALRIAKRHHIAGDEEPGALHLHRGLIVDFGFHALPVHPENHLVAIGQGRGETAWARRCVPLVRGSWADAPPIYLAAHLVDGQTENRAPNCRGRSPFHLDAAAMARCLTCANRGDRPQISAMDC